MALYVLATKLGSAALNDSRGRRKAGQEWKAKVERLVPGVRWVVHYAVLGRYDFLDVYEAPNDEAAMLVSLLSRELGASSAESWPAMAYESFLHLAERVEEEQSAKKR
jgi:uncharacterized protein with GYD domain